MGISKHMLIVFMVLKLRICIMMFQPSLDYIPDVIVLNCGANDLRDEIDPANISNGIIKLAKSIKHVNNANYCIQPYDEIRQI